MKATEIKNMPVDELNAKLDSLKEELFALPSIIMLYWLDTSYCSFSLWVDRFLFTETRLAYESFLW